ncbi:MAG: hypothetical protein Q7R41_20035 [Phycisphaerales bacterium]|nr:hypothetical protein [Phycisphaerales bacterium]
MTPLGWIFMLASNLFVWGLTFVCFYWVLTTPSATEHMESTLDIDTHLRDL